MSCARVLDEIGRLDPERDHQHIVFLSTRVDFPFDTTSLRTAMMHPTYPRGYEIKTLGP